MENSSENLSPLDQRPSLGERLRRVAEFVRASAVSAMLAEGLPLIPIEQGRALNQEAKETLDAHRMQAGIDTYLQQF